MSDSGRPMNVCPHQKDFYWCPTCLRVELAKVKDRLAATAERLGLLKEDLNEALALLNIEVPDNASEPWLKSRDALLKRNGL